MTTSQTLTAGFAPIVKQRPAVWPNLADYDKARELLPGLPGDRGLNIACEAIDRHAAGPLANKTAIRWISRAWT